MEDPTGAQALLSYSRPSHGKRTVIDARAAIYSALDLVRPRCQELGIRIETDLGVDATRVEANSDELGQVFLNLVLNAVDAMPAGGTLAVAVSDEAEDGRSGLTVRIEDSGVGIPPAIADRVFEPFFTTKEAERGTGLGLSICYGLVKSHRGTIRVDRRLGGGSIFNVWLPAVVDNVPPATRERSPNG